MSARRHSDAIDNTPTGGPQWWIPGHLLTAHKEICCPSDRTYVSVHMEYELSALTKNAMERRNLSESLKLPILSAASSLVRLHRCDLIP